MKSWGIADWPFEGTLSGMNKLYDQMVYTSVGDVTVIVAANDRITTNGIVAGKDQAYFTLAGSTWSPDMQEEAFNITDFSAFSPSLYQMQNVSLAYVSTDQWSLIGATGGEGIPVIASIKYFVIRFDYTAYRWIDPLYVTLGSASVGVQFITTETVTEGIFEEEKRLYYKISFIYDGTQESPLSYEAISTNTYQDHPLRVSVSLGKTPLSERITAVNVYRAESDLLLNAPQGFYRLVETLELDTNLWRVETLYESTWGKLYTAEFIDRGKYGVSYESNTGIGESIEDTNVNYKLQCVHAGWHFVANAYHPFYEDATHMVFRSKANAPDQFDVANDYVRLPVVPTAIVSFAGYVWAFSHSRLIRINPGSMVIEDIVEGIGCSHERAVLVTDYGMFFGDGNSIYLHDGKNPVAIGGAIRTRSQTDYGTSYLELLASGYEMQIVPFLSKNLILFTFTKAGVYPVYFAWSLRFKAWFYFTTTRDMSNEDNPAGLSLQGGTGFFQDDVTKQTYICSLNDGIGKLWTRDSAGFFDDHYFGYYYSQRLVMNDASQVKRLYAIDVDQSGGVTITRSIDDGIFGAIATVGEEFLNVTVAVTLFGTLRSASLTYRPLIGKRSSGVYGGPGYPGEGGGPIVGDLSVLVADTGSMKESPGLRMNRLLVPVSDMVVPFDWPQGVYVVPKVLSIMVDEKMGIGDVVL
jgi:hypothetical protein